MKHKKKNKTKKKLALSDPMVSSLRAPGGSAQQGDLLCARELRSRSELRGFLSRERLFGVLERLFWKGFLLVFCWKCLCL